MSLKSEAKFLPNTHLPLFPLSLPFFSTLVKTDFLYSVTGSFDVLHQMRVVFLLWEVLMFTYFLHDSQEVCWIILKVLKSVCSVLLLASSSCKLAASLLPVTASVTPHATKIRSRGEWLKASFHQVTSEVRWILGKLPCGRPDLYLTPENQPQGWLKNRRYLHTRQWAGSRQGAKHQA